MSGPNFDEVRPPQLAARPVCLPHGITHTASRLGSCRFIVSKPG